MKVKANFYTDNADVQYQLKKGEKIEQIYKLLSKEEKEMFGATNVEEFATTCFEMLEAVGDYAGGQLADNAADVDREDLVLKDGDVVIPPTMQKNISTFLELGAHALSVPIEFGGMDAPILMELAGSELLARSCPSTLLNVTWYGYIAVIIDMFGSQELKEKFIPLIASGEMSGSMALTEPDTGSDLANMRSYAEEQDDGSWKNLWLEAIY